MFDANKKTSTRPWCFSIGFCVGVALLVVCGAAMAGPVTCEPETISFSGLDESATIRLVSDGSPVPSEAVRGARAMIDDRNYSYQFLIDWSDEGPAVLTIRPNPAQVEMGTFTLRIATRQGPAKATIKTPLDTLPGTLANRAKAMGITTEQLKAELNLLQPAKRERVGVALPDSYQEGFPFELPLGSDPEHEYRWLVNGRTVESGKGKGTLDYVFSMVGPNSIQYEERENGGLVAAWSGTLNVNPTPAVPWKVPAKTEFTLNGPPGFQKYTWTADGKLVGNESVLQYAFKLKGDHTLECLAEDPVRGDATEYRRMTWRVVVE